MTTNRSIRRARRGLAAAGVAVLALSGVAAACGDDAASPTTTITSTGGAGSKTETTDAGSSKGDSGSDSEFAKEVEARGEPTVAKVDGPVAELKITDDVVGTGAAAAADSTVTAQYVGAVANTGEVFQSSWKMDGAIDFPLNQVIEGWSKGLVGMKEGGRRTVVIPAAMAYGATPPPGSGIPKDADLVFTVDLVKVG